MIKKIVYSKITSYILYLQKIWDILNNHTHNININKYYLLRLPIFKRLTFLLSYVLVYI